MRWWQGNAWQMLGEEAPVAALVHALMPLAEELDDHLALGIVSFERSDMAVAGRLAHRPQLSDMVGSEVQVEALVEDVEPRAHRFDDLDGAGMDLDAAAIADEAHDRDFA